ncbi:MHO_4530 family protein [Mycoplasmopsis felifaucium]|uniref:Uncharacterized protein n=1 Tax=Mycoplasmopsis felifaucium TaxID=35768 RepID=A0ABZ2RP96_9BACT|nr:hypothetical protein [Mycoplasmopsis felifaucium]
MIGWINNNLSLFIFLILDLVCIIILVSIIFSYMFKSVKLVNNFNTNGLILFKIDTDKKTIIRLSDKSFSNTLNIDDSKYDFDVNNIVTLEDFSNFFDDKSKQLILNYLLSKNHDNRVKIYCNLNIDKFSSSPIYKTFAKMNINLTKTTVLLRFNPTTRSDKIFCSLEWQAKSSYKSKNKFYLVNHGEEKLLFNNKMFCLSYVFAIDEFFFNAGINKTHMSSIINAWDLNKYKGNIYYKNGILQFFIYANSYSKLLKMQNKALIKWNNNKNYWSLNPYYKYTALLSYKCASTFDELKLQNLQAQYLLYNAMNGGDTEKYKAWFIDDNVNISEFNDFSEKLKEYKEKIKNKNLIKEIYNIRTFPENENTNMKVVRCRIAGISNPDMNFFRNIWWYRYKYTHVLNDYILSSENNNDTVFVGTSIADVSNFGKYRRENTVLVLKPSENNFDYSTIEEIIKNISKSSFSKIIQTGLYIDEINEKIFNIIQNYEINYFIVSEELINRTIIDEASMLKLRILIDTIEQSQKALIIYENLPKINQKNITEKLNIKYYLNISY